MPGIGVIFDNDGVLVDTEQYSIEAYRRAIEEQGVTLDTTDTERNCGLTDADIIRDMRDRYGAQLDLKTFSMRKAQLYHEIAAEHKIRLFPGVKSFISNLREMRIPYILASSGSRSKIAFNLEQSGLSQYFPMVVSGDDFQRGKPDPEIFLCAAEKLGLAPRDCVVIEDSINGLKAARTAGCFAIAVSNTFPREKLAPFADLVVQSLEELSPQFENVVFDLEARR
jgi:HAD superfamily hydrolase (TIGR01509 family)